MGAGVASGVQNRLSVFVGPKDIDTLRKVNPKLETLVDWGFFGVIAKPLFLCLNWVNDNWTHNFGWAIILVTGIINFLLLPLKFTSLRSARRMQALQPKIQAINAKYKDISMRDPRKAEQNQEVMALYKENGVNPVGGCLPMLVQLPFFYAFYRVLNIAIELRGAPWLWVSDLSRAEIAAHSLAAHHSDCNAIPDAAHDSGRGRGPQSAEDDDVHAADIRLHVLLRVSRPCTILVNRQRGGYSPAADHQSLHAHAHAGTARSARHP